MSKAVKASAANSGAPEFPEEKLRALIDEGVSQADANPLRVQHDEVMSWLQAVAVEKKKILPPWK